MNAPKSVEREAASDIAWLKRLRENGHCGEGTLERQHRQRHNDRIDRLLLALSGPVSGMDTRPSNANPASSLHGEPTDAEPSAAFQARVLPWMLECFGPVIPFDREERGDRLLEEVFELLQSGGYDPARVLALRDYVWGRAVGDPAQEAGGVMVTMAAYCIAFGLDMAAAGETELARIWTKVPQIRAKQAAKPTGSALPIAKAEATATEAQHSAEWLREGALIYTLAETGEFRRGEPVRVNRFMVHLSYDQRYATQEEYQALCERVFAALTDPPSPAPPSSEREGSGAEDRS